MTAKTTRGKTFGRVDLDEPLSFIDDKRFADLDKKQRLGLLHCLVCAALNLSDSDCNENSKERKVTSPNIKGRKGKEYTELFFVSESDPPRIYNIQIRECERKNKANKPLSKSCETHVTENVQ